MEDEGTSLVDIPIRLMFRLKFTAALGENERQTSKLQGDLALSNVWIRTVSDQTIPCNGQDVTDESDCFIARTHMILKLGSP